MTSQELAFVREVKKFHKTHGRHMLPWRTTKNPYRILVSEIMLQQTQVNRVLIKYKSFLKKFPTVGILAQASLGDVIREWQGLGYNRRAKLLHVCAKIVSESHKGVFPKSFEGLVSLPGIGPYTAGAIMAFAYNIPIPIIETNIRTVFIHHFFNDDTDISDSDILRYVESTLDRKNPREWYAALMDYGTYLKQTVGNLNSKSKHYTKQSSFMGSDRQIRGAVLKLLSDNSYTRVTILKKLPFDELRIDAQLLRLAKEQMILVEGRKYKLP